MKILSCMMTIICISAAGAFGEEPAPVELSAAKDTFGRSNNRNGNCGASEFLLLAPMPGVKGLIGFDLSSLTNEITSAAFSFRIHEAAETPLSLTIAPLVHNEKNAKWVEGSGNLGVSGQNARIGEATFQWRAFRDRPWKDAAGKSVVNLMDTKLWEPPTITLSSVEWTAGTWIRFKIQDVAMLEAIRQSEFPTATFGIWGTSGKGVYKISSKESGYAPKLVLTLKENEE